MEVKGLTCRRTDGDGDTNQPRGRKKDTLGAAYQLQGWKFPESHWSGLCTGAATYEFLLLVNKP